MRLLKNAEYKRSNNLYSRYITIKKLRRPAFINDPQKTLQIQINKIVAEHAFFKYFIVLIHQGTMVHYEMCRRVLSYSVGCIGMMVTGAIFVVPVYMNAVKETFHYEQWEGK